MSRPVRAPPSREPGASTAWQEELASRDRPQRLPVSDELVERERAALVSGTRAALAKLNLTAVAREWNAAELTTTEGSTGPKLTYLATGIVVCSECRNTVSGRPQSNVFYPDGQKRRQYLCRKTRKSGCGKVAATTRAVTGIWP